MGKEESRALKNFFPMFVETFREKGGLKYVLFLVLVLLDFWLVLFWGSNLR